MIVKFLPYILAVALGISIFFGGIFKGEQSCGKKEIVAIQKEEVKDEKIEKRVMQLPDDKLTNELLRNWMRS